MARVRRRKPQACHVGDVLESDDVCEQADHRIGIRAEKAGPDTADASPLSADYSSVCGEGRVSQYPPAVTQCPSILGREKCFFQFIFPAAKLFFRLRKCTLRSRMRFSDKNTLSKMHFSTTCIFLFFFCRDALKEQFGRDQSRSDVWP